jgi:hypothetical protein
MLFTCSLKTGHRNIQICTELALRDVIAADLNPLAD